MLGTRLPYTLVAGTGDTDNASFTIDSSGNLQTAAAFDFESKSSYSIRVRSTDQGGLSTEKVFTVSVTDANEAPTDIALSASSIAENQASGTTVGSFGTTDPDAGTRLPIPWWQEQATRITPVSRSTPAATCRQLRRSTLNQRAAIRSGFAARIRAACRRKVFTVSVTNVNEVPIDITLSAASVAENQSIGTTAGAFSTTDVDAGDTFTYTLVTGTGDTDNSSFTIDSSGNLLTAAIFDFEAQGSYSIRVRVQTKVA